MAASELKQAEARPSRFSSPSRPRKTDLTEAMDAVRSLGTGTAAFALLQSLAWMVMSLVGGLVYRDVIPSPDPPRWRWSRFDDLITNLYFKANPMFPELPEDGLATPLTVYRFMGLTLIVNFVWFITSSVMFRQVRLGGRRSAKVSVIVWSLSTALVTVLDVVVGTIFGRDTVLLASDWPAADDFYGDPGTVIAIAAGLMLVALRFVVLLVANVVCMGVLLRRASRLRPDRPDVAADLSPPPSATAREGPIDAFLYRNEDRERMGIQNPVFVPDSPVVPARQPWQSFRPEQAAELGRREELAERRARAPATKSDPDDMSYLSWMEDVDKHVEMRSRPRPSAPPSVSSSAPSYRQSVADQPGRRPPPQRQVQTFQGAPAHHRPAGDTAFRPASQEARLPRLRLNPDAPKFPFIPPPDYSPQAQRRPTSRLGRTDR